jgi:hypothetical protein
MGLMIMQSNFTYQSNSVLNNRIAGDTMSATSVTINSATLGKTYTFTNSTNSFGASSRINYSPPAVSHNNYFLNLSGCAAFVTFKNTSLLSSSAQTFFRQTPFSFGTDSALGGWNFERFYTNSNYNLRVKFDQDGSFGFAIDFGSVPLNEVCQLGFTIRDNFLRLYKNGILVTSSNISSKTLNSSNLSSGLNVSVGASSTIYGFIGEIYNATWWNTNLTDNQIKLFYNQTISRYS